MTKEILYIILVVNEDAYPMALKRTVKVSRKMK
jgi:hypothetical protein